MKPYYPIMLDLSNKQCVVIGGGKVSERKVKSLIDSKASVTVISPVITANLQEINLNGSFHWIDREYRQGDLTGYFLVIIATDNEDLNLSIYNEVDHSTQFVNIADNPELCTFIVPSVVKRGHLQLSISTHGASPGLAKKIRQDLEKQYGEDYINYTDFLAKMREWIFTLELEQKERQNFFAKILKDEYAERIFNGEREEVEKELKSIYVKF